MPCSVQKITIHDYAWMAEEIKPLNWCSDLSGQLKKQPSTCQPILAEEYHKACLNPTYLAEIYSSSALYLGAGLLSFAMPTPRLHLTYCIFCGYRYLRLQGLVFCGSEIREKTVLLQKIRF